jgi:predicted peroxiredoxin
VEVSLWLTGDATAMMVPGRAEEVELAHAVPLAELRDTLLEDARVTVCGQCAARRGLTVDDLMPGVVIRGAAAFVEEVVAPGARALVY